jgi:RND family efflux transporter MFP subunit
MNPLCPSDLDAQIALPSLFHIRTNSVILPRLQSTLLFRIAAALVFLLSLSACRPPVQPVSGTIEVDEVHVAPRSGGRVVELYAQEGDRLEKGHPIARLVAPELQARRELAQAQINSAVQDAEALKAQLAFMRADARRQQELLRTRTISPSEAERAQSAADAEEKSLEAARMRIKQMQAQLAEIDAELRELDVVAPSKCILEILNVKVGDVLAPNQEVATLILPQHLWVRVYVPETWLGHIKLGQQIGIRVDSFPNEDFAGTVEQVNRKAEFTPRNVQTVEDRIKQVFGVKIRLQNHDDKLCAGMSADAIFPGVPKKP